MLPGGILNDGFALAWVTSVIGEAQPYGQGWEQARVDGGDTICRENQLLHGQLVDNVAQARQTMFYDPAQHDRSTRRRSSTSIDVPVFLGGGWQDEQTGPYFFPLLSRFTSSPATRLTIYNGVHPDGFAPDMLGEWYAFLKLFVAHQIPTIDPAVHDLSPLIVQQIFHSLIHVEETEWASYSDVDAAIAAWRARPPVRAIFERGAGKADEPGAPVGTFERTWPSWPPPSVTPQRLYFHASGALDPTLPTRGRGAVVVRSRSGGGRAQQPGAERQRVGRAARLRLGAAPGGQRHRLRDGPAVGDRGAGRHRERGSRGCARTSTTPTSRST